jgi:hypothetical protein
MKLPPDVQFYEDIRLLVWKPHGVLNEAALKHIFAAARGPFHGSHRRGKVARRSAPSVVGIRAEENPASKLGGR